MMFKLLMVPRIFLKPLLLGLFSISVALISISLVKLKQLVDYFALDEFHLATISYLLMHGIQVLST